MVDDERAKQTVRDEIDKYSSSIHAIVGFANFYLYDDARRTNRPGVRVFQGLRLTPSVEKATTPEGNTVDYVTPDLGVLLPTNTGCLVRSSCPSPKTADGGSPTSSN
jgi:hypothetical protein